MDHVISIREGCLTIAGQMRQIEITETWDERKVTLCSARATDTPAVTVDVEELYDLLLQFMRDKEWEPEPTQGGE